MVGYGHPGASWGLWTGIIGRILGISANPIGTLPDVVEAQSEYARKSYEKQIAQATKLGQNVRRSLRERLQES